MHRRVLSLFRLAPKGPLLAALFAGVINAAHAGEDPCSRLREAYGADGLTIVGQLGQEARRARPSPDDIRCLEHHWLHKDGAMGHEATFALLNIMAHHADAIVVAPSLRPQVYDDWLGWWRRDGIPDFTGEEREKRLVRQSLRQLRRLNPVNDRQSAAQRQLIEALSKVKLRTID